MVMPLASGVSMVKPLRTGLTVCYLYHYGWVNSNTGDVNALR